MRKTTWRDKKRKGETEDEMKMRKRKRKCQEKMEHCRGNYYKS